MPVPDSMTAARDREDALADLRRSVATQMGERMGVTILPFGIGHVDDRLTDGGLSDRALHEVTAASLSCADEAAMVLFVAGIAARFAGRGAGPVLWATTRFDLYAPGLEQAGLAASSVIYAEARDDAEVLALLEDAVRDGCPGAVVGEARRVSMTATRRLQLASGDRGVPVFLLRRRRTREVCALSEPSAAATRWRIGCSPSPRPIAGLARARWTVELVRQRGGEPFSLMLEACDHEGRLALPAATADRAVAARGEIRSHAA